MNGQFLASAALTLSSLAGYVLGTVAPYPGREASIAGLSVGVTLASVTYSRSGGGSTEVGSDTGSTDPEIETRDGGGSE